MTLSSCGRSVQSGNYAPERGHTHDINALAISPNGAMLASGSDDHTIKLWQISTGQELRTLKGHTGIVYSVAYTPSAGYANSPDGEILASASNDKTIKLWQMSTGKELRTLTGHTGIVYSVAITPDGRSIVIDTRRSKDTAILQDFLPISWISGFRNNCLFLGIGSWPQPTRD